MKYSLFLGGCFLIIIILPFIPVEKTIADGDYTYTGNMLPGLFTFLLICFTGLLAVSAFTYYSFKQKFNGGLVVKRTGMSLRRETPVLAFWLAFILVIEFLSYRSFYFFKGLPVYFIFILVMFGLYLLFKKWAIKKLNPDYLSIDGNVIYFRSQPGKTKRGLKNLLRVSRVLQTNSLLLQFEEGLQNINLNLADYAPSDLRLFIDAIKKAKSDSIQFEEDISPLMSIPG